MSTLSLRAPGVPTMRETTLLRVREVTTINSVKRNLFGCSDSEENRRFFERELARQSELDSQRWGFDFSKGTPLSGTQRLTWQLVSASSVPTALRRAAVTPPKPIIPSQKETKSPDSNKTQKRITEFLKPRKRLKSPGTKHECGHGAHIRPPKVSRLAPVFKRTS